MKKEHKFFLALFVMLVAIVATMRSSVVYAADQTYPNPDFPKTLTQEQFDALNSDGLVSPGNGFTEVTENTPVELKGGAFDVSQRRYFLFIGQVTMKDTFSGGRFDNNGYAINAPLTFKTAVPIFAPNLIGVKRDGSSNQVFGYSYDYKYNDFLDPLSPHYSTSGFDVLEGRNIPPVWEYANNTQYTLKEYVKPNELVAFGFYGMNKHGSTPGVVYPVRVHGYATDIIRGRVRWDVTILNESGRPVTFNFNYGVHVDVMGAHTFSSLYSNGRSGLYFEQVDDSKVADGLPAALYFFLGQHNYHSAKGPTAMKVGNISNVIDFPTAWTHITSTKWNTPMTEGPFGTWDALGQKGEKYDLTHPVFVYRWDGLPVNDKQTGTISLDMALKEPGVLDPDALKEYRNLSADDGINYVGDMLEFKLTAMNNSIATKDGGVVLWNKVTISDKIPQGLDVDVNSFRLVDMDGQVTSLPSSVYNPITREVKYGPVNIQMQKELSVLFNATISARGTSKITNTMYADGDSIRIPSEVEVPVVMPTKPIYHLVVDKLKPFDMDVDSPLPSDDVRGQWFKGKVSVYDNKNQKIAVLDPDNQEYSVKLKGTWDSKPGERTFDVTIIPSNTIKGQYNRLGNFDTTVTINFKNAERTINVEYYKDGKIVPEDSKVLKGKVGDPWETEKKEYKGYHLVKATLDDQETSEIPIKGIYQDKDQTVRYYYEKDFELKGNAISLQLNEDSPEPDWKTELKGQIKVFQNGETVADLLDSQYDVQNNTPWDSSAGNKKLNLVITPNDAAKKKYPGISPITIPVSISIIPANRKVSVEFYKDNKIISADTMTLTGKTGEAWTAEKKNYVDYHFVKATLDGNEVKKIPVTGVYTKKTQVVRYYYEKNFDLKGNAVAKDMDRNSPEPDWNEVFDGKIEVWQNNQFIAKLSQDQYTIQLVGTWDSSTVGEKVYTFKVTPNSQTVTTYPGIKEITVTATITFYNKVGVIHTDEAGRRLSGVKYVLQRQNQETKEWTIFSNFNNFLTDSNGEFWLTTNQVKELKTWGGGKNDFAFRFRQVGAPANYIQPPAFLLNDKEKDTVDAKGNSIKEFVSAPIKIDKSDTHDYVVRKYSNLTDGNRINNPSYSRDSVKDYFIPGWYLFGGKVGFPAGALPLNIQEDKNLGKGWSPLRVVPYSEKNNINEWTFSNLGNGTSYTFNDPKSSNNLGDLQIHPWGGGYQESFVEFDGTKASLKSDAMIVYAQNIKVEKGKTYRFGIQYQIPGQTEVGKLIKGEIGIYKAGYVGGAPLSDKLTEFYSTDRSWHTAWANEVEIKDDTDEVTLAVRITYPGLDTLQSKGITTGYILNRERPVPSNSWSSITAPKLEEYEKAGDLTIEYYKDGDLTESAKGKKDPKVGESWTAPLKDYSGYQLDKVMVDGKEVNKNQVPISGIYKKSATKVQYYYKKIKSYHLVAEDVQGIKLDVGADQPNLAELFSKKVKVYDEMNKEQEVLPDGSFDVALNEDWDSSEEGSKSFQVTITPHADIVDKYKGDLKAINATISFTFELKIQWDFVPNVHSVILYENDDQPTDKDRLAWVTVNQLTSNKGTTMKATTQKVTITGKDPSGTGTSVETNEVDMQKVGISKYFVTVVVKGEDDNLYTKQNVPIDVEVRSLKLSAQSAGDKSFEQNTHPALVLHDWVTNVALEDNAGEMIPQKNYKVTLENPAELDTSTIGTNTYQLKISVVFHQRTYSTIIEVPVEIYAPRIMTMSVPETLPFKEAYSKTTKNQTIERQETDWPIEIDDNRINKDDWELFVRIDQDFTLQEENDSRTLKDIMIYRANSQDEGSLLSSENQKILWRESNTPDKFVKTWGEGNGFLLHLTPQQSMNAREGNYQAILEFTLKDAP